MTLLAFSTDLNIYSYVGLILLVGLVKKNAIIMIDVALEAQRRDNKPAAEPIVDACLVRFRPIMMTTMCALMGTLPIAIGWGAGAEARRPLGIAVVGGLAFSQLVTLYVTPVIYSYLDSFQFWLKTRWSIGGATVPPSETDLAQWNEVKTEAPALIDQVNAIVARLKPFYQRLLGPGLYPPVPKPLDKPSLQCAL